MRKESILYILAAIILLATSIGIMKLPNFVGKFAETSATVSETNLSENKDSEPEANSEVTTEDTTSTEDTTQDFDKDSETTTKVQKNTAASKDTDESADDNTETTNENTTSQTQDYSRLINFKAKYPYLIKVNRAANCVTVYGIDYDGKYTVPYKTMTCSTGLDQDNTPLGTYYIYEKYDWRLMIDGSYSQYAVRFNGGVMFHSIPYYSMSKDDMEWEEYNKLGTAASLGCVRLQAECAKWIYDNCPMGTTVIVYDDADNPGELGKDDIEKIPEDSEYKGWDPTDPDALNPWRN